MKATKITYWVLTAIVALMMYYSAFSYLTAPQMAAAFNHLGYPDYFRVELAIAKLIGATLLFSAFIAHTCSGDPVSYRMMPVIFLAFLIGSYITYHKKSGKPKA
jgi:ABC-type enterobactin transport system permease subunit